MSRIGVVSGILAVTLILAAAPLACQTLEYSTYLGGGTSFAVTVDGSGFVYVAGDRGFTRPDQTVLAGPWVVKVNPQGNGAGDFEWAIDPTGLGNGHTHGMAQDASGNLYALLTLDNGNGHDFWVFKIDAQGLVLYSVQIGAAWSGGANGGIAVDGAGALFVTGTTPDPAFPQVNMGPVLSGANDAFVAKFTQTGNAAAPLQLVWGTFLGGSGTDASLGMATDAAGNAYVSGWTNSSDFPTFGGFQPSYGGGNDDAFAVKFDATGLLVFATFIGGSGGDQPRLGLVVDDVQNIYITGLTASQDFPVAGAFQSTRSGGGRGIDGFVTRVDTSVAGSASLVYSTYLGGSKLDICNSAVVLAPGIVVVAGRTRSTNFPITPNALFPNFNGREDSWLAKLDTNLAGSSSLLVSTYFGGSQDEIHAHVAMGPNDAVYLASSTFSSTAQGFPTTSGAFIEQASGGATLAKFAFTTVVQPIVDVTGISPNHMNAGSTTAVTMTGSGFVSGATVTLENGVGPAPVASNVVVVDGMTLTATLTVSNGGPRGTRVWDVRVTNPDTSTGVLQSAFSVTK